MVRPVITNSLKGSLGQTYYKELCSQRGWAYCSLENLHGYNLDSVLFKKGFDRLRVYIPKEIRPEVSRIATPSNNSQSNPSYVFDYLACKIGNADYSQIQYPKTFCWAEVKTGLGIFSENQFYTLPFLRLPIAFFHIKDVLDKPENIEMDWNMKSGLELADDLDSINNDESEDADVYDLRGVGVFSNVIFAKYDGICNICGRKITQGVDKITQSKNYDWVHEQCALHSYATE